MQPVYDHAGVTVYEGDCLTVLPALPEGSVQLVVTSPPYFNAREYSQWETYQDYLADMERVWRECYRVLCQGGRIAVNVPLGYGRNDEDGYRCLGDDTTRVIQQVGFVLRGHVIWDKTDAITTGTAWGSWMSASNPSLRDIHELIIVGHKGTGQREPGVSTIDRLTFLKSTLSIWRILPVWSSSHPAPFPLEIPRRLIELYSYQGDTVLDPFLGSGTTTRVARDLGRQGIGIELKPEYVSLAIDRVQQERFALEVV